MTRPKLLLIGERQNLPRSVSLERSLSMGAARWVFASKSLGALPRCSRFECIGLSDAERDSMNLLPPAPQSEPWNPRTATKVAVAVALLLAPEYDGVVLCGRRVATAFGHRLWPFYHSGQLTGSCLTPAILVPHPSGLSRAWNDECEEDVARAMVAEFKETLLP